MGVQAIITYKLLQRGGAGGGGGASLVMSDVVEGQEGGWKQRTMALAGGTAHEQTGLPRPPQCTKAHGSTALDGTGSPQWPSCPSPRGPNPAGAKNGSTGSNGGKKMTSRMILDHVQRQNKWF